MSAFCKNIAKITTLADQRAESLEITWKMPEGTEAPYNQGFVQPVIETLQSQATKVCSVIVWLSVPLIIVLSFSHNPCVACNQTLPHAILVLGKRLEGFCSLEVKTYVGKDFANQMSSIFLIQESEMSPKADLLPFQKALDRMHVYGEIIFWSQDWTEVEFVHAVSAGGSVKFLPVV